MQPLLHASSVLSVCMALVIYFLIGFSAYSQICDMRLLASSFLPVCLSVWNNSAPSGRICMKLVIRVFQKSVGGNVYFT